MLFNSVDFIVFFPVVVLLYFVVPRKLRQPWLLITSYYFYMGWNAGYALLLLFSTVITYACGLGMDRLEGKHKKLVLAAGFLLNLAILVYFKYFNFGIDTLNQIFHALHLRTQLSGTDVLLPVGISFYIFQALGYTMDVYRGEIKAEKNFLNYALFVSFFPQLVAGPIERSGNLLRQIKSCGQTKLWNYERVTDGLVMMLWGYFMKMVIADRIANLVDTVFDGYLMMGSYQLIIGAVGFAIQIYCDFGGYSLIAIGAAKVMGFELMENFNAPYFAVSVSQFWRRWHISLSSWFRDYLYFPLGGSRCSKWKNYRNILIVFAVSGLWHGASWSFVIWGLLHGIYQILEKTAAPYIDRINKRLETRTESIGYRVCRMVLTFTLVDVAWVFFRADTISQALIYLKRIFTNGNLWAAFDNSLYELGLNVQEMNILLLGIFILLMVDYIRKKKGVTIEKFLKMQPLIFRWPILLFLLFFVILFGCYGPDFNSNQFIYFQF